MTEARLKEIERKARDAFWSVVAEECPEVATGDFPPDLHFEMSSRLKYYINAWYELNTEYVDIQGTRLEIQEYLDKRLAGIKGPLGPRNS